MIKSASTRAALLPYPVIAAAVRGEPDAVNMVVRHYSGYIAALSTRTSNYDHGGGGVLAYLNRPLPEEDRKQLPKEHDGTAV